MRKFIVAVSPPLALVLLVLLVLSCAEKQWPPLEATVDRQTVIDCIDNQRDHGDETDPAPVGIDAVNALIDDHLDSVEACLPE